MTGLAINVDTFKGTVQLSGFANSAAELRRAEAVAGVEAVRNDIGLKLKIPILLVIFLPRGCD